MVLDDLIDPELIAAAEREELEPSLNLEVDRSYRKIKAESPEPNGPAASKILESIGSAALRDIFGRAHRCLRIDSGSHALLGRTPCEPTGAFQAIHRDFRVHPITGLFHRVNILIYLNSNWKSEYGGELELWKI